MIDKKLLYDLKDLGYQIVYLPEYDWYFVVTIFKNYTPSNHIHHNDITGKDITEMKNNQSLLTDKLTINSFIGNIKERTIRFDKDLKFLWLT